MSKHLAERSTPTLRRAMRVASLVALTTFVSACAARRAPLETISTDRPGFSDAPGLVAPGRVQLTAGYSHLAAGTPVETVGELLLRVGVSRDVELRLQPNSYVDDGAGRSGLQDAKIGAKVRIPVPGHGRLTPALALVAGATIPTGSAAFGHQPVTPDAKLAATWTLSSRYSFTANAGGVRLRTPGDAHWVGFGTANLGIAAGANGSIFVEAMGTASRDGRATDADAGFSYRFTRDLQVDAWVARSLTGGSGARSFGLGIARQW